MSRMAQEVQRQVNELHRAAPRQRRTHMGTDEKNDTNQAEPSNGGDSTLSTSTIEAGGDMATKRSKSKKAKTSRKAMHAKGAGRRSARKVPRQPRVAKVYRLVDGVPDGIREGSTARDVLEYLQSHQSGVTAAHILGVFQKVPTPTIRFYLGKWQREKIVTTK